MYVISEIKEFYIYSLLILLGFFSYVMYFSRAGVILVSKEKLLLKCIKCTYI